MVTYAMLFTLKIVLDSREEVADVRVDETVRSIIADLPDLTSLPTAVRWQPMVFSYRLQ